MATFSGAISSGRGKASGQLVEFAPAAALYLEAPPVEGSLNLVLNEPVALNPARRIAVGAKGRSLWGVRVNGVPALAYRWRGCPLHIMEIISHHHLRHYFGKVDGDWLDVEIDDVAVLTLSGGERAAWNLCWNGRRSLYYSSSDYRKVIRKIPLIGRLSAQQSL